MSLPALSALIAMGACQWSGVATNNRVQPRHFEHLAMIAEEFRAGRLRLRLFGAHAINIADRGQRRFVQLLKVRQKQTATGTSAYQRHRHAVVRAQNA
jgi:hypothetical protein